MHTRARAFALCAAVALGACVNVTPPGILVASSPAGARILVDGVDSGFVTPANLAVDDDDHWVELQLEGYAATALLLKAGSRLTVIPWSEGTVQPKSWAFPLFLPAGDLLLPYRTDDSPLPSRVHVYLRLADEG
jgi:hypothetical protein